MACPPATWVMTVMWGAGHKFVIHLMITQYCVLKQPVRCGASVLAAPQCAINVFGYIEEFVLQYSSQVRKTPPPQPQWGINVH